MDNIKLATVWLAGCSGCHMSFLDLDEWLFDLASHVDVVYTPIADIKDYPEGVDVCLVEGAIALALYKYYPQTWLIAIPGNNFDLGNSLSPLAQQGMKQALGLIDSLIQENVPLKQTANTL